jgi:hypothetical protein
VALKFHAVPQLTDGFLESFKREDGGAYTTMKLAHYTDGQKVRVGVVKDGKIFSLSSRETIDKILAADALNMVAREAEKVLKESDGKPIGSVKLCSPILNPGKMFMVANNYPAHSK